LDKHDLLRTAGTMIGLYRERKRIRPARMAETIGISRQALNSLERGASRPSPAVLIAFRQWYGVDLYVWAWALSNTPEEGRAVTKSKHKVLETYP
jgi:transcriptional regulator with XRE-family HTH domain